MIGLEKVLSMFPHITNLSMFYFHLDSKTLIMLIQTSKYFHELRNMLYKLVIQNIWYEFITPRIDNHYNIIYGYTIKNVIYNNKHLKNKKQLQLVISKQIGINGFRTILF